MSPKKIKTLNKVLSVAFTLFFALVSQSHLLSAAEEKPTTRPYNQNLLLFTMELEEFVSSAKDLRANPKTAEEEQKAIESISETAYRIAFVYFDEANDQNRTDLDNALAKTIKENSELKTYFTLIGNEFSKRAEKILVDLAAAQKKTRVRYAIGGSVVGLALGGGYLYAKVKWIAPGQALTAKDYLIAATAFVGSAAAGFGVGAAMKYYLPVDRAVANAKDFQAKYPKGEDFNRHLEGTNADLSLGLNELGLN